MTKNLKKNVKKVKSAVKSVKAVGKMNKEIDALKSSYKTGEFWLVVLANIIVIVGALNGILDPTASAAMVIAATAAHDFLRVSLKKSVDASNSNVTVAG